jgi:tripartite-type tricarboxylate transporter receptor subunit TctC
LNHAPRRAHCPAKLRAKTQRDDNRLTGRGRPMTIRRPLLAAAIAAATLALSAATAPAQWPQKPIRVIVPFGPGGTTDVFARQLQKIVQDEKLAPQPITVLNVGGHFSVGSIQAKNAAPDGSTFLVVHLALLSGEVVDPSRNLSYRDFEPVALTGGFCLNHIVREDSPFRTLKDLVDAAKAKPGEIVFGVNIGALNHMGGGFLERAAAVKFRFVQIGGGGENFAAIKGGVTQTTMLSGSEYENFKSGGVRALAYTGPARNDRQADVPTVKELGYAYDFCINNYWFAPKGTPKEAIDGMAALLEKAMATEAMKTAQTKQASITDFLKGDAFRKNLDDTFKAVEPVAKELVKK